MCCRYLALPIDTPQDQEDFDDIRWYLLHERVAVFVEDGDWYLQIATDCRHLQPDFRCNIYDTRPRICREYTTENCDYHSGDYGWELHFACPEDLDQYAREFFAKKHRPGAKRRAKTKEVAGRPRLKAKLGSRRAAKSTPDCAKATADIRGTPLPPLEVRR
jgi:Fe-S-cluster containining protein